MAEMSAAPGTDRASPGWLHGTFRPRLAVNLQSCLALLLILILLQQFFRALHIGMFHEHLDDQSTMGDLVSAFVVGLRFDARAAFMLSLPALAWSLLAACGIRPNWQQRGMFACECAALFGVVLLGTIQLCYFNENGNIIDHHAFDFVTDYTWPTLVTIWKSLPVTLLLIGLGLALTLGMVSVKVLQRILPLSLERVTALGHGHYSLTMGLFILVLIMSGRGAIYGERANLDHTAFTDDRFVGDASLNATMALRYAYRRWSRVSHGNTFQHLMGADATVSDALQVYRPGGATAAHLEDALAITATGPAVNRPRHVFLYLLESCDSWTLQEPWLSELDLVPQLRQLGERGYLATHALADGEGTSGAFGAFVSGIPQCEYKAQWAQVTQKPLPTAPAVIFKQLGYRTRIFYGGPETWQNLAKFARNQGFDEIYSLRDLPADAPRNEWGVHDVALHELTHRVIDDSTPSFNMVITVTNHPPFDQDPYAAGFPHREIPAALKNEVRTPEERYLRGTMGHHWLADKYFGESVARFENSLPNLLVCATGDHWCRHNPLVNWQLATKRCVPILLYGPDVIGTNLPPAGPASHRDLIRTLVEASAPAGFVFPAFGNNLLQLPHPPYATASEAVIGDNLLHYRGRTAHPKTDVARDPPEWLDEALTRERAERALAWWWLKRGPAIHSTGIGSTHR